MCNVNPYALAWRNTKSLSTIERPGPTISSQPPTFGALPYLEKTPPATKRFFFTAQGPGIIQRSDVVESESNLTIYKIRMEQAGLEFTSVWRPNGIRVGYIVWKTPGPEIKFDGVVGYLNGKDWLRLSPDRSSCFMRLQRRYYTWQFARKAMYFYAYFLNGLQQLGKVYYGTDGTTVFEASDLLISHGMLDSIIPAITLLLSERFRD